LPPAGASIGPRALDSERHANRMPRLQHLAATGLAVLAASLSLLACARGTRASSKAAVRVGDAVITKATVDHWMSVMGGGRLPPASAPARIRDLRRQALDLLITSAWLLGEAARQGLNVTAQEANRHRVEEQTSTSADGRVEAPRLLEGAGQTLADVGLQARAELASSRLVARARDDAPRVTRTEVARDYARHRRRFAVPELREARITNRKTWREAQAVRLEVERGASFMTRSERELVRYATGKDFRRRSPLERAIRTARPNALMGPLKQGVDYFVFELKRVVTGRMLTLRQVEGSIRQRLTAARRRRALTEFVKSWRSRWIARTRCYPGYVVQRCSQYDGPAEAEDPLQLD
jgi:hypothetical protein